MRKPTPCDTDFNQHVKREYICRKNEEFIQPMQDGISVPTISYQYGHHQQRHTSEQLLEQRQVGTIIKA